jgi:hypothetical protein
MTLTMHEYDASSFDQAAFRALANILSSPVPPECALHVFGLYFGLSNDAAFKSKVMDLGARWISLRRSPADVKKVLSMKCACSFLRRNTEVHKLGAAVLANDTLLPGQMLFRRVPDHIRDLSKYARDVTNLKLHDMSSRSEWPSTVAQLLPHGPGATIRGYLDWFASDDVGTVDGISNTLLALVAYAWQVVTPVMVKLRLLPDQFIDAASRWSKKLDVHSRGPEDYAAYYDDAIYVVDMFANISVILMLMCNSGFQTPRAATFVLRPWHEDILVACDHIIATTTSVCARVNTSAALTPHQQAVKHLKSVVTIIYELFPQCRTRSSQIASLGVTMEAVTADYANPNKRAWKNFVDNICAMQLQAVCAAPECSRTTEQHGRWYRACVGCRRVRYCSRMCQRKAWRRNDGLQHRDACAFIRYICTHHTVAKRGKGGVSYARSLSAIEMTMIDIVCKHFSALTMYGIEH